MPKVTISYYDDSVHPGGTTRYLLSLIRGLDRASFRPILLAPERREWHRDAEALDMEVVTMRPARPAPEVRPVAANAGSAVATQPRGPSILAWTAGTLREAASLRGFFSAHRTDLFHSNNAGAEVAPIAARLAGFPRVLATWHVDSTYDLDNLRGGWNYRLLETACMRSLHHSIAVSEATARDWVARCKLGESSRKRITVVPNGIDVTKHRRRHSVAEAKRALGLEDRLVLASMGRLEPAKGYEYLIQALPALVARHPEVLVRVAGRGPLMEALQDQAKALGVTGNIQFLGFTAGIQDFLETADVYVQPSLCEAMPMSILEASAVGIPIVAANVGGVAECVLEGQTGRLVPSRDPAALSRALDQLVADAASRDAMASAAAALAESSFSVTTMVSRTEAVYRRVLSGA